MTDDSIIRELLAFDADSGRIIWVKSRAPRVKVGDEAGSISPNGYRQINLAGQHFQAHRIAWMLHYGEWPDGILDHINGEKADNRIDNLRMATKSQNGANRGASSNNKTGFKGVKPRPSGNYQAQICANGQKICLGTYRTAEEAHAAYVAASVKYFGEFARAS